MIDNYDMLTVNLVVMATVWQPGHCSTLFNVETTKIRADNYYVAGPLRPVLAC